MLPKLARLHTPTDFRETSRRGRRGASATLVVHMRHTSRGGIARVGFVVSKKVGNSVIRHRVTRRLRSLVYPMLSDFAPGCDIVIRALPAAALADSRTLGKDLTKALDRADRGGLR